MSSNYGSELREAPAFSAGLAGFYTGYILFFLALIYTGIVPVSFLLALIAGAIGYNLQKSKIEKSLQFNSPFPGFRSVGQGIYKSYAISTMVLLSLVLITQRNFDGTYRLLDDSQAVLSFLVWISVLTIPLSMFYSIKVVFDNQQKELSIHRKWFKSIQNQLEKPESQIPSIDSEYSAITKSEIREDAKIFDSNQKIDRDRQLEEQKESENQNFTKRYADYTTHRTKKLEIEKKPEIEQIISALSPTTQENIHSKDPELEGKTPLINTNEENQFSLLEQFSGYFYLVGLTFIILAVLTWIILIFPETTNLDIGTQTWIAGDTLVILSIFLILFSEFVISRMALAKRVPVDYFTIAIGFIVGLLGLTIMRFQTVPDFLPTLGILDSYWLIVGSGLLLGALAWIYAWRTPYKDFLFILYASAFISIDFSLNSPFGTDLLLKLPFLVGFLFLWAPGIVTIFQKDSDSRFIVAGIITQNLLLLRIENMLALIALDPILFVTILIIPATMISINLYLRESSPVWLLVLLFSTVFSLVINEIAYYNMYIDIIYYSIPIVSIFVLLTITAMFKKNLFIDGLLIGIFGLFVNIQGIRFIMGLISADLILISLIPMVCLLFLLITLPPSQTKLRLAGYLWTLAGVGSGLSIDGWMILLYLFTFLILIAVLKSEKTINWLDLLAYLVFPLVIITVSSFLTFFHNWEVVSTPIIFLGIVTIYRSKVIKLNPLFIIIGWISSAITINLLILSHFVFAELLLLEYLLLFVFIFAFYWIDQDKRAQIPGLFWLLPFIGLILTGLIVDYDQVLFAFLIAIAMIITFLTAIKTVQEQLIKRNRQLLFDATIVTLHLGLFAYILLEPFDNSIFLSLFAILLVSDLLFLWYSIRYSGMDLTFAILFPALLLIAKELIAVRVWASAIIIEFSFLGFILVLLHSFVVAWLSRRSDEAQVPLISPLVTAFFANELVLLILFVNEIFVDLLGLISFLLVLGFGILLIIPSRYRITHIEFALLQLITGILSVVLVASDNIPIFPLFVVIPLVLPIFWLLQRISIKTISFTILDTLVFGFQSIFLYIWSLRFPDEYVLVVGSLSLIFQMLVGVTWVVYSKRKLLRERISHESFFFITMWTLIPFIALTLLGFDLMAGSNLLWSLYLSQTVLSSIFWIWLGSIGILLTHLLLWITFNVENSNLKAQNYVFGIVSEIILLFGLLQLFFASLFTESELVGLGMLSIGNFLIILTAVKTYQHVGSSQITYKSVLLVSEVLVSLISVFYFVNSGLIPAYWALIGTGLLVIGLFSVNNKEQIGFGVIFFVAGVVKVIFDFLTNFNVLTLEIAFSSSILAISLLIAGYSLNYYVKSQKTE